MPPGHTGPVTPPTGRQMFCNFSLPCSNRARKRSCHDKLTETALRSLTFVLGTAFLLAVALSYATVFPALATPVCHVVAHSEGLPEPVQCSWVTGLTGPLHQPESPSPSRGSANTMERAEHTGSPTDFWM